VGAQLEALASVQESAFWEGMDRTAAQAAFSQYLNDRSLTVPQIRFIEMIIDQLTPRGMMDAAALYEPPFSNLHAGGPDALFAGKENVIDAIGTLGILHHLTQRRLADIQPRIAPQVLRAHLVGPFAKSRHPLAPP
jgi:hypothetical protein